MKPSPLYLAFLLVVLPCRGEVIENILLDPGFEGLGGTAPDAATSPWFTGDLTTAGAATPNASGGTALHSYRFGQDPGLPRPAGVTLRAIDHPSDLWFRFSVANDPALNHIIELGPDLEALSPGVEGVDHEKHAFPSPSGEALEIWVRPLGAPDRFFLRHGVE